MKNRLKNCRHALLLAFLALPLACKSTERPDVPCTCGTPMADVEGCVHPSCLAGKTNPDNPDCVCGPLSLPR